MGKIIAKGDYDKLTEEEKVMSRLSGEEVVDWSAFGNSAAMSVIMGRMGPKLSKFYVPMGKGRLKEAFQSELLADSEGGETD